MQKVYLQGGLYLRKGPKPTGYELAESLRNLTYILHGKECDVNEGEMDYSYVDEIHQLIINNNKMYLRRRDNFAGWETKYIPITKEELEHDYIDFMEFLKESTYIGKYGKMTKPAGKDKSFVNEKTLVLYQSKTHMIIYDDFIKEFHPNNIPIQVLNSRYCNDWEFYEESTILYQNPTELYKDIYKESFIQEKNKGRKL